MVNFDKASWKQRGALLLLWLACAMAATIALGWLLLAGLANPKGRRAMSLLTSFDQTANAAFGGDPDWTITQTAKDAMRENKTWAKALCRLLDIVDPGHCGKIPK